ncbi:YjbQ family protein [Altererythrobacter aerius]|uniref:YjbQ family protein n=1 Tax=Tsuneonella aeria TaxID=1837929 RepID=A0A6I4TGQ2_9SPHN|nr:YjbQ family protein [Tsuneonella aeria]
MEQGALIIETAGRELLDITARITVWLASARLVRGTLSVYCRHTSAGLLISENADPAVLRDLRRWLDRLAPETAGYEHDDEGPDDMPAHIKAMLTGGALTIPFAGNRLLLGTWQAIYLAEHRARSHRREIVLTGIGE